MKKKDIISLAVIVLLMIVGLWIYSDSLAGGFVWDDLGLVKENVYIHDWSHIKDIFTTCMGTGAGMKNPIFYRPTQVLSYVLDYHCWGLDPIGYHLSNVITHITVALVFMWLVYVLFDSLVLGMLSSFLFLIHPVHTEAVCYISGRSDSLVALSMISAFIFYIKNSKNPNTKTYIGMILCYVLALLSKESSIILPLILVLYHICFKVKFNKNIFFSILGLAGVYVGIRFALLISIPAKSGAVSGLLARIPGFFVALTQYITILFLPIDLHMEHGKHLFAISDYQAIIGILISILLIIYAFRKRNKTPVLSFSIGWFFITLLPVSNIYPVAFYMAEHYLYLPSMGVAIAVAYGFLYLFNKRNLRKLGIILYGIVVVSLIALTLRQNAFWKDPISFYKQIIKYSPDSKRALMFMGEEYFNQGMYKEVEGVFKRVLEINPDNKYAYNYLGAAYAQLGRYDESFDSLQKAFEIDPYFAEAYANLGILYIYQRKTGEAIAAFNQSIEYNPNIVNAYFNLGVLYTDLNDYGKAKDYYRKALEIKPDYLQAYSGLVYILNQEKKKVGSF